MSERIPFLSRYGWWLGGAIVGGLIAARDGPTTLGWFAYLSVGAAAGAGFGLVWRAVVGARPAKSLALAVFIALVLRLGVGLAWSALLPTYGNDEPHHRAGVFFPDAFVRDRSGWTIGRTDTNLMQAFNNGQGDQYGTLLFLTASVYRVFGPQVQSSASPAAVAAAFGALAVLLTWGFVSRLFGDRPAELAAWVMALYPDAVLLGSEAMREPFVMAGVAAALYGFSQARQEGARSGLGWIVGGVLICLAVSPPFAVACALIIGAARLWDSSRSRRVAGWVTVLLAGIGLAAGVLTLRAWAGIEGSPAAGQGVLAWWIDGVQFQMDRLYEASGWVQVVFGQTPPWTHVPLATAYGLVQPFLPAALTDTTGVLLMGVVMSLRAAGWFAALPVLLYAPAASIRRDGWRSLILFFTLVFVVAAVLVSYRFAGDQWDSPRYRAALLPILAAIAGWAWCGSSDGAPRWLLWVCGLVALETLIAGWWYAGRYFYIPRLGFFRTLGLGLLAGAGYLVLAAVIERRHGRSRPRKPRV